ncbi:hypothetical protein AGMMS50268_35040 [Spirochaetia bacterium]|nr:hypothetical protein AGMMS50268_35040 [Spirochaetia bacterium]
MVDKKHNRGIINIMNILIACLIYIPLFFIGRRFAHGRYSRFDYNTRILVLFFIDVVTLMCFSILSFNVLIYLGQTDSVWVPIVLFIIRCINGYLIMLCTIKRLHDLGTEEFMALLSVIPIGGSLFSLFIMFGDSQEGVNEYDESINYQKLFPFIYTKLELFEEGNLLLLIIKDTKLFIKKENYKYTIMFKRDDYQKIYEDVRFISNKPIWVEKNKYCYYKNIKKQELLEWVNKQYG